MSKKDNDSLEEFFRKATRHHDLEYNEEDWKKLERMLDAQQPVRPAGWFSTHGRKVLIGLAAITAVVITWLLLPVDQATENVATNPSENIDTGIAEAPNQQDDAQTAESFTNDGSVREGVTTDTNEGGGKQDLSVPPGREENLNGREKNSGSRTQLAAAADERNASGPNAARDQSGIAQPNTEHNGVIVNRPAINRDNIKKDLSEVSGFNHTQIESRVPADPIVKADGVDEQVSRVQAQPVDSASVDVSADALEAAASGRSGFDNTRGRFGITVVAAPDFSRTPQGGAMGTGDAMGAFVHYQVLPRWGITTGVLYTNKKYWGKGAEYRPPYGYWKALTNGVVPDRIDGTCSMYEVPVAVTFDIVSTRKTRLFASAGLSSYFVQSEEYYYHFDAPNPGAVNGWTGKKPSTLWFGIGTLSAGLDFRASRTLSLGIEPYFKVPLEGMGWADVDLYSTGVMFAVRYHFAKKANKHPPTLQGP